jgi:pyruvate dehydrogenase E1 component alpha subunit
MGDPERYRQKDEVKKWQEEDPIGIYRRYLLKEKIASSEELDDLESKVEAETQDAIEFAESSPEPAPEELFKDIYADN